MSKLSHENTLRCGYVAIIGRPNVGKSTLLNNLLGKKVSITSRKPQTTRHQVQGIKTRKAAQIIFIDTPGIQFKKEKVDNRNQSTANRRWSKRSVSGKKKSGD